MCLCPSKSSWHLASLSALLPSTCGPHTQTCFGTHHAQDQGTRKSLLAFSSLPVMVMASSRRGGRGWGVPSPQSGPHQRGSPP